MSRACEVVVIGDLLLDILFYIDRGAKIDGLSHVISRALISPGGVGGNISTALSRLGVKTCLVSAVGGDAIGRYLLEDLGSEGIDSRHVKIFRDKPSGVTVAFVEPDGSRTLFSYRGACEERYVDLDSLAEALRSSKFLFISGYLAHSPWGEEAMIKTAELASRLEIEVGVDFHEISGKKPEILEGLREKASYVFLNIEELRGVSGEHDLDRAVRKLDEMLKPKAIFVKMGEKGSTISYSGKLINMPAYRVKAVDTTGCGDAFDAGVIYGIVRQLSLKEAARLGNMMGAYKATGLGPRHLPKGLKDLNTLLHKAETPAKG
ncbi:MAG TPA: carbohydrate kinase family protein [Sulfolobales archaeon]|nr:carbohydrate kinase family protein [Sulfolobales archaeon]